MKALPKTLSRNRLTGRPAFERIVWIAQQFRSGERLNCNDIARRFECSTKTAFRDIEFLRDRLAYELEYERDSHVYRLTNEPEPLV